MPAWPGGPHVRPDMRSPAGVEPGPRVPGPATPDVGAPIRHLPSPLPAGAPGLLAGLASRSLPPLPLQRVPSPLPAGAPGLLAGLASRSLPPLAPVGRADAGLPPAARARARRLSAML